MATSKVTRYLQREEIMSESKFKNIQEDVCFKSPEEEEEKEI